MSTQPSDTRPLEEDNQARNGPIDIAEDHPGIHAHPVKVWLAQAADFSEDETPAERLIPLHAILPTNPYRHELSAQEKQIVMVSYHCQAHPAKLITALNDHKVKLHTKWLGLNGAWLDLKSTRLTSRSTKEQLEQAFKRPARSTLGYLRSIYLWPVASNTACRSLYTLSIGGG